MVHVECECINDHSVCINYGILAYIEQAQMKLLFPHQSVYNDEIYYIWF